MNETELADEKVQLLLQVVSFRLHQEIYALNILHVQEIIKALPVTPVPHAHPWIAGVINLRGQIIPLIYLARRLELDVMPAQRSTRFVIVRSRDQSVGLVVDEVLEVLRLHENNTESPPNHLQHRDYIQTVSKQERGMIMVLDLPKILYDSPTRNEAHEEAL